MTDSLPVVDKILNPPAPDLGVIGNSFQKLENGFLKVGLDSPDKRFVFFNFVGGLGTWAVRPESMFDRDGTPRPWIVSSPGLKNATTIPWWMPGLALGTMGALFV